jgi:hypothetical protein
VVGEATATASDGHGVAGGVGVGVGRRRLGLGTTRRRAAHAQRADVVTGGGEVTAGASFDEIIFLTSCN